MQKTWLWALVPGLLIGATGCPEIDVDENEVGTGGPIVEFDPSNRIIPFPNNLLIDPATGKVNLPAQCNESPAAKATREGVLNQLDGFGTYEVGLQVTFTEPVDMGSLANRIVLYKRASGMTPVDPATAMPVPVIVRIGETTRFTADCASSSQVPALTIIPRVPLDQKSVYTVGVLAGVRSVLGSEFGPSLTWALVRQAENPVTVDAMGNVIGDRTPLNPNDPEDLATLQGINLLWNAHAQGMAFLEAKGHARTDVVLAWEFKTQTVTDPLDPSVAGSLAANVAKAPLLGVQSLTAGIDRTAVPYVLCPVTDNNTQCYLKIVLGAGSGAQGAAIYTAGDQICAQVGCANVGDVVAGALSSKQYQVNTPNAFDATKPIPGPFADPIAPPVLEDELVQVVAFVPAAAPPAGGYPTVIFGHGLGSSKNALFAIGPQLATPRAALGFTSGFMSVAIDFVGHGSRAIRVSSDAALGCADTGTPAAPPSPSNAPQCYAPFLSTNLALTRDNIRQSILDLHGLREALKACGTTACDTSVATFQVDPAHISYAGQSLGSTMGGTFVATSSDLASAVLNVGGVGWMDVIENTDNLTIRCGVVNGLIDAGVLMGEKWDPQAGTGLCTTGAWKTQPGYRTLAATARWILDPADQANFTRMLATRRFLIQEVVGDEVIPNVTTDNQAALTGVMAMAADPAASATPAPSAAITTNPMINKFVKYETLPANGASGFPGNTFSHSSWLRPTNSNLDGQLGTIRLQVDSITYLVLNR